MKNIDKQAKEAVLKDADIIVCTLNFSGNSLLDCLTADKNQNQPLINAIIIDEVIMLKLKNLIESKN